MKIKTYIFLFTLLLPGFIFGQNTFDSQKEAVYDSLAIAHIESLVDSIRLEKNLEILRIDSVFFSSKFSEDKVLYHVDIHHKGKEIVRMSLSSHEMQIPAQYSIGGSSIDYFLDKNQLIFVEEKYTDRSRMGSCGTLSIENRLYYKEGNLLTTSTQESPFTCYSSPIEKDWLYKNFETVYELSVRQIKR